MIRDGTTEILELILAGYDLGVAEATKRQSRATRTVLQRILKQAREWEERDNPPAVQNPLYVEEFGG